MISVRGEGQYHDVLCPGGILRRHKLEGGCSPQEHSGGSEAYCHIRGRTRLSSCTSYIRGQQAGEMASRFVSETIYQDRMRLTLVERNL